MKQFIGEKLFLLLYDYNQQYLKKIFIHVKRDMWEAQPKHKNLY